MTALHDDIFDDGLSQLTTTVALVETFHILNADPGLTFGNIATFGIGNKATPPVSDPTDRTGGGREVVVPAITDGNVTATDTATHWALTDDSLSKILASGSLSASQAVTNGNTFTTTEFTVGIPDPA